jgi:hypothetical protein
MDAQIKQYFIYLLNKNPIWIEAIQIMSSD